MTGLGRMLELKSRRVMRSTDHVGGEHGGRPRDAVSRACKPHCDVALVQIQNMHVKLAYDWFGLDAGAQIEKGHRGRRTMCVVDMTGVQETRLRGLVCRICVVALVQIQNMLVKLACQRQTAVRQTVAETLAGARAHGRGGAVPARQGHIKVQTAEHL